MLCLGLLLPSWMSCSDGDSGSNAGLYYLNEIENYGYLWQLGLSEPLLADESCVPTSFTNSMVFLQTEYEAELDGIRLVEEGYAGWTQAAETLRSEPLMDTRPRGEDPSGTQAAGEIRGILGYLESKGASPPLTKLYAMALPVLVDGVPGLPDWIDLSPPTLAAIYNQLVEGAVLVVNISYGIVGPDVVPEGHALAIVGVDWVDSNGDGVVDKSENAKLVVVDPLDSSENYGGSPPIATGPVKKTLIHVWDDESGRLAYSYFQYQGDSPDPFEPENFLTTSGQIESFLSINVVRNP